MVAEGGSLCLVLDYIPAKPGASRVDQVSPSSVGAYRESPSPHREARPPFSPDAVVHGFAALLKSYRVGRVTGDRYAGEFPRELFRRHGIAYGQADQE